MRQRQNQLEVSGKGFLAPIKKNTDVEIISLLSLNIGYTWSYCSHLVTMRRATPRKEKGKLEKNKTKQDQCHLSMN
jgi:hypothetical protein